MVSSPVRASRVTDVNGTLQPTVEELEKTFLEHNSQFPRKGDDLLARPRATMGESAT